MARIVVGPPEGGKRPKRRYRRRAKYDALFETWLDGRYHELRKGEDYETFWGMRTMAQIYARSRHRRFRYWSVELNEEQEPTVVVVQFEDA